MANRSNGEGKVPKTQTVKFNVGGQIYEVSKSVLGSDNMLSRSVSGRWYDTNKAEIFIDRDAILFSYVLKYLRDNKVSLPLTVSKNDLINELSYYGIAVIEESIDDSEAQGFLAVKYFNRGGQLMTDVLIKARSEARELFIRRCCLLVVADCIEAFMREGKYLERFTFSKTEFVESCPEEAYFGSVFDTKESSINFCNEYLKKVGLRLKSIMRSSKYMTSISSTSSSAIFSSHGEHSSASFGRGYSYEMVLEVEDLSSSNIKKM